MLELESVTWQNFLSYGDYQTTVNLANVGGCLISGEVVGEEESQELFDTQEFVADKSKKRSNGAGKSTIPNVIMWALFGRTMHDDNPGNNVINWFTEQNCIATVTLKNGDKITRTRKTENKNELIYIHGGNEIKLALDTLSTAKNQQAKFARDFNLDWDIFCGSCFFSQYAKPWLEMQDNYRKKVIERLLHIDRYVYYAQAAKSKYENIDLQIGKCHARIESSKLDVVKKRSEIERLNNAVNNFAVNQQQRIAALKADRDREIKLRDAITTYDVEKLQARWDIVRKAEAAIGQWRTKATTVRSEIAVKQSTLRSANAKIAEWEARNGKICVTCEQEVASTHVAGKIEPYIAERDIITAEIAALTAEAEKLSKSISAAAEQLEQKKPSMTVRDAQSENEAKERHGKAIARIEAQIAAVEKEENPHTVSADDYEVAIAKLEQEQIDLSKTIQHSTVLSKHLSYINSAYTDRKKIKHMIFTRHIPYFNARLKHYFDVFNLDIKLNLTSSLAVESNLWGYKYMSGGERKRADVAFMFAMYDLHENIYGRQCNVVVLDEVDGRMDDDGVDALINIIQNDIVPKVETVFVISHKNLMKDVFPHEIVVKRVNRLSTVEYY